MQFSVIIPTLNESDNIARLIRHLQACSAPGELEILVVDAGSTDHTADIARQAGARVILAERRGRSQQMNQGAREASHDWLYFLHADTIPPTTFIKEIREAIEEGYSMGCFRFRFNSDRRILHLNSYLTRFNALFVRGGDQSLFIPRELFMELGAFREDYIIMEDFEFLVRARRKNIPFKVIQNDILVSARKYETNSYMRVQLANGIVFLMFRLGFGQQALAKTYKTLLDYR